MGLNSGSGSARGGLGGAYQDPDDWKTDDEPESLQVEVNENRAQYRPLEKIVIGSIVLAGLAGGAYVVYSAGVGIYNCFAH